MNSNKTISVIGAGYVGLTTGALLANSGFKVHLIDIDPKKIQTIQNKQSPFFETGLNELISLSIDNKSLLPTTDFSTVIPESGFVFCCVGTPDKADGSSNLDYVFSALQTAASLASNEVVLIQKSTVPAGTGEKLIKHINTAVPKLKFSYVSNPEFLREGTAIADSLWPDRIVVGSNDPKAAEKVLGLYTKIQDSREQIATHAKLKQPAYQPAQKFITSMNSAELIKVTANAFLALKISFANSIAKLADKSDADINQVMDAVGSDRRIGRAFLSAGRGYGGGCFPKDVSGLINSAKEFGVDLHIMTAVSDTNESMPGYIAGKAKAELGGLAGKKLAVLGLAFKAGTSDARRSPGVKLANILSGEGAKVSAYDPQANDEAGGNLRKDIIMAKSIEAAIKDKDAVFIATDWPEFLSLNIQSVKKTMAGNLLVDCLNAFDKVRIESIGFKYLGVGR